MTDTFERLPGNSLHTLPPRKRKVELSLSVALDNEQYLIIEESEVLTIVSE